MEKLTEWRDKGTGIAPFFPPSHKDRSNIAFKMVYFVLFVIRLIIGLPLLGLYMVTGSGSMLGTFMKVCVTWKTELAVEGVKRRDLTVQHYPHVGGIYLVNYSSVLDGLLLRIVAQGPMLIIVCYDNTLYSMTLTQFIRYTLSGALDIKRYGKECNKTRKELANYVVYIIPEGTTSNGKSVLPFAITQDRYNEFLGIDVNSNNKDATSDLFTFHLRCNPSLVTPLRTSITTSLLQAITKNPRYKCKIALLTTTNIDNTRIQLNDNNKYTLVSKSLTITSKKSFVKTY